MAKKAKREAGKRAVNKKSPVSMSTAEPKRVSPLQRHFEKAGIRFDLAEQEILAEIKKIMGGKRHTTWRTASLARQEGRGCPEEEYRALHTAEEVNTLFSLQSHASLKVCDWLATQVSEARLQEGHIGDLGCGAGVLAGWLAKQHPACQVVGLDALPNMVQVAASSQKARNLSFRSWDYANAAYPEPHAFDVLVSCFGVDFPILRAMPPHSLVGEPVRKEPLYRQMHEFLRPFFRGWRTAIKDGGKLFAVLRIPGPAAFLGAVDAAHGEGWKLDISRFDYVATGTERCPALAFAAEQAPPCTEEVLVSLWCRNGFRTLLHELPDAVADCVYRSLGSQVVKKKEVRTYDDGYAMEALVGHVGYLGFQYTHATTGFARLKLMSLDEAEHAEPWFPTPPLECDF